MDDDFNMYEFADEVGDVNKKLVYNFNMYTSVFDDEELRRLNTNNSIQSIANNYNTLENNDELIYNIYKFMLDVNKLVNDQAGDSGKDRRSGNQFQFLNFYFDLRFSKLNTSQAVQLLALLL